MGTVIKIMLGVLLAGVLLIGGCVALLGAGVNSVDKSVKADQAKSAISSSEARKVELGTPKADVIAAIGKPRSSDEGENSGLGKSNCIYYNVKDGGALDSWQFCFSGSGKLESKPYS